MHYLVAIVAGIVIGLLRGGRPDRLARVKLRRAWLLFFAVVLSLLASPLPFQVWLHLASVAPFLQLAAFAFVLAFTYENRTIRWLWVAGVGVISNMAVMVVNGGQIPVDGALLAQLGDGAREFQNPEVWVHYRLMEPNTNLPFLGDVIFLGPPFPPRILSPGDVIIGLGLALVVQSALLGKSARRRPSSWAGVPR